MIGCLTETTTCVVAKPLVNYKIRREIVYVVLKFLKYWNAAWNIVCNDILNFLEDGFKSQLGIFLTDQRPKTNSCANGALFLNNMKLEYEIYPDDLKNGAFNITVSW